MRDQDFVDRLRATLPDHAAALDGIVAGVTGDERWRWLELGCSVAAGRGDHLSDLDLAVGAVATGDDDLPVAPAEALVRGLGPVTDLLVHRIDGRSAPHRRIAAELASGVQLDLVVMPAANRPGLPPGSVALVDKDGTLGHPWVPDAAGPPTPDERREWAYLGWWALSDAAKYLARGAPYEAIDRIAEARRRALQLHAAAAGVAYPGFGLTSILDEPDPPLPEGVDATYPSGVEARSLHGAALATATLLGAVTPDVPLAGPVRARLAAALPAPPVLDGELVRLRPARREDVSALAAIRRRPEVHEHWRGGGDLVAAVEEDLAEEGVTKYVIEVEGRLAGWIQWEAEEEPDYRSASMDIYVDPAVHGRGIGTDAVRTLARHLIDDEGHHHLTIDPATGNAAAIRCYTKVGFRPVGVLRQAERGNDGTWHDALLMDLLPDDLRAGGRSG